MFRRGLVAMTGRLLLCVAFVASILVLVACTETTEVITKNVSSASETSTMMTTTSKTSYASLSSSTKTVKSKPKCRRGKKCPKNEEFSFCPGSIQRAQYCSEKAKPYTYISTSSKPREGGCVCKENYLRAENGTCIPAAQCPVTCGVNEILVNCPTDCQSDYCPTGADKEAKPCVKPDVCPPAACKCAFNHRRASNGSCIPTRECPPYACGTNEEYNPCPPLCPTDDCSQASPSGECPQFGRIGIILPCNPKCRCIKDYWRLDGICVPYGQCPGVCPANERYSTCTQAECRALNCTQKDKPVSCIRMDPKFCKKGCVCKEGYLRNDNGICVLEDKCETGVCPANERYSTCTQAECRALNCTQKGQSVPCIRLDPKLCKKGCVCKEGYLRNKGGICVLEDKCETGVCPANERYSTCTQAECRALNCTQKGQSVPCIRLDPKLCKKGCVCKEGYLRNKGGICVLEDKCEPGVCPANERYSTCTQAECRALNCTQKGQSVPCIRLDPKYCKKGCVCKEGYLRNKGGICVLEDKCEPPSCTSAHEEFVSCMQGVCRAKDCSQKGEDVPCPDIPQEQCDSGCICKEHFLRAANGSCVPEDQCEPGVCPANERYSTCTQAECRALNCTQKGQPVPCIRLDPKYCKKGCVCKEGYLRNKDGLCVLEDKCEPPSCSSANEEFVSCMQGVCRAKDCSQKGENVPCPDIPQEKCDSGCICKEHFLRAANGSCVPEDQCEPNRCQPNEEFSNCIQVICRTLNCSDKGIPRPCPMVIEKDCKKGCVCQEGYLRTEDGCITDDKCNPNKCPLFEVWDNCANAACRAEYCTQKGLPVPCPSVMKCLPGCLCRPDYLRNAEGFCVPEDVCNTPKTCGENEVLDNCPRACTSDNCPQSADEKQVCTEADPCVPACKCRLNYRRAENGTCIPTSDCPPFDCSAKPNEEYVACPPLCPTDECGKPRLEGRCPFKIGILLHCNPKCQCKDGYGRVNGTCVPFEQCPGLCPTNEVYSSCVQQTCRQQNCSDRDVAMKSCPSCDEASCKRGCVCQENYYRNDKGVCVPYDECEAPKTCGENEVLDNCPRACTSDNCPQSADEKQVCTEADPCVPACKCRFNYRRAENGTCIPTTDCPPFDCSAKPNEEYVACPPLCPTDECGKPRLEGRCPFRIGILLICNPKCQCKDGYGRVNGTCVPFEQCPGLCPTNEVYSSCVQKTCRQQKCADRDLVMKTCPSCDKSSCQRGCVCQDKYYRNDKGVCVSYEQCGGPMCPNAHEEYKPDFKECPPNTCKSLVEKIPCDKNQKEGPGCVCESGYLRINVTSHCIPICDCPEMKYSPDC